MTTYPVQTRRWTRAEYDRLIEVGIFRAGEPIELLGGELIVAEPQGSTHDTAVAAPSAPFGWRYASRIVLGPEASAIPLAAPSASIAVRALLP